MSLKYCYEVVNYRNTSITCFLAIATSISELSNLRIHLTEY